MNPLSLMAISSAWLVMLHLGMKTAPWKSAAMLEGAPVKRLMIVGLVPSIPLLILAGLGLLTQAELLGLLVCLWSGTGTSAVPIATRLGASSGRVFGRLMHGAGLALVAMPLLSLIIPTNTEATVSQTFATLGSVVGVLALAMVLPWWIGRTWQKRTPLNNQALERLGKVASLTVLVLIIWIAVRELPKLPDLPWLVVAGGSAAAALGILGRKLEYDTGLAATVLVKNLTLATVVLLAMQAPERAMTALAAFGALMYLAMPLISYRMPTSHEKSVDLG